MPRSKQLIFVLFQGDRVEPLPTFGRPAKPVLMASGFRPSCRGLETKAQGPHLAC